MPAQGEPARRMRRQRQVERIWRLGARVVFELLDELDRSHALPDLDARIERYSRLDPDVIRAVQADRFPPAIHLVPGLICVAAGRLR